MDMTSWDLYIDDSRDGGLFVLGGYMAPSDSWSGSFTPAWHRTLEGGRRPVPEFKASDCRHGVRSFKEWSSEERTALTSRLVTVLVEPRNRVFGVACAVLVPRAHELRLRHAFESLSYVVCLTTLIAESLKTTKRAVDCDSLHVYLDEQAKVTNLVPMAFESSQRLYAAGFEGSLHQPEFRKSIETPPLQAADLLAYETLKEIRNRRARPQRPVSKALAILTSNRPHVGRFVNLDAAVPDLTELGERLPGVDSTRLGVIYDHNGVEHNRGRRLERVSSRK